MGNSPSFSQLHNHPHTKGIVPNHVSFYIPVFATYEHYISFLVSSTLPYIEDPLFGSFVISSWFEQISHKLSNEDFLNAFRFPLEPISLLQPIDPHTRLSTSTLGAQSTSTALNTLLSLEFSNWGFPPPRHNLHEFSISDYSPRQPSGIPINTFLNPDRLDYRPSKIELDTNEYPILLNRSSESDTSPTVNGGSAVPPQSTTQDQPKQQVINTPSSVPSHIPFLKIGLPLSQIGEEFAKQSLNVIPDRFFSFDTQSMIDKILPFRSVGRCGDWKRQKPSFKKGKPYQGLGGNGNKSEFELFSQYKDNLPCPSIFTTHALEGYNLDSIARLPAINHIPAYHIASVVIIDISSTSARIVLNDFILQTVFLLQRGCIIPLININLYILQLNANILDSRVIGDDEIIERLTQIGFSLDKIRLIPTTINPEFRPFLISAERIDVMPNQRTAYPLLARDDLSRFTNLIWSDVYKKLFSLHQHGYWDQLKSASADNPSTHLISPRHFPVPPYHRLYRLYLCESDIWKQPSFCKVIKHKGSKLEFHQTDPLSILERIVLMGFYGGMKSKALEYYGPCTLQSPDDMKATTHNPKNPASNTTKTQYELIYHEPEPDWSLARTHLPFFTPEHHLILDPQPLYLSRSFDYQGLNSGKQLPVPYRNPFRLTKIIPSNLDDGTDDEDDENYGKNFGFDQDAEVLQSAFPIIATVGHSIDDACSFENESPQSGEISSQHDENGVDPKGTAGSNPHQTLSQPTSHLYDNNPIQQLIDQLLSHNLPQQYEFESFILRSHQVLISDQNNFLEVAYFPQPHVQNEIINTIEKIRANGNAHDTSLPSTHPSTQTDLTKHLRAIIPPRQTPPSLPPLPYDYLMMTAPHWRSRWYPHKTDIKALLKESKRFVGLRDHLYRVESDLLHTLSHSALDVIDTLFGKSSTHDDFHFFNPGSSFPFGHLSSMPRLTWNRASIRKGDGLEESHQIPPAIERAHPTARALTYVQSRVEFKYGSSAEQKPQRNDSASPNQRPSTHDSSSSLRTTSSNDDEKRSPRKSKQQSIKIGLTYLHRSFSPQLLIALRGENAARYQSYATYPLSHASSFLPLMWMHGIIVLPFIYTNSRTKIVKEAFVEFESSPLFDSPLAALGLNIQEPTKSVSVGELCDEPPSLPPHPRFASTSSDSAASIASPFDYPIGFIPPPIPAIAATNRKLGLEQDPKYHDLAVDQLLRFSRGENHSDLTQASNHDISTVSSRSNYRQVPLLQSYSESNVPRFLQSIFHHQGEFRDFDPSSHGTSTCALADHNCPITFIVLISNPVVPDPIPYRNVLVDGIIKLKPENKFSFLKQQKDQGENMQLPSYITDSRPHSPFPSETGPPEYWQEPITQSQLKYFKENIPKLYKRQLTEQIFGYGLGPGPFDKLQRLWFVEVHTPETVSEAIKRLELVGVETRLKMYRDLALASQQ